MAKPAEQPQHLSLHLQGLVQGVGLRPHVVRLAAVHGVSGTVARSTAAFTWSWRAAARRWKPSPRSFSASHRNRRGSMNTP